MRVAWFRPKSLNSADALDATPALIRELAGAMTIDVVTQAEAHNFVVEHALRPYDVCVFELRNAPESDFIWAYLFQYPGVLLLQDASLHDSRARGFERYRRVADYESEFQFNHAHPSRGVGSVFARGGWPMHRAALLASKLVVVTDAERRRTIEAACPAARVRDIPAHSDGPDVKAQDTNGDDERLRVSVVGEFRRGALMRSVESAASLAIPVVLAPDSLAQHIDSKADVVIALDSPSGWGTLTPALTAMALQKAVVVFEREATAEWPALDPQTWRPRDDSTRPPIVVSLDPRDENHSLALALRRLWQDRPARLALGDAAREWWMQHATPAHAALAWRRVLDEAITLAAPARPADWPSHLDVDGTEQARAIAANMGVVFEEFGFRAP